MPANCDSASATPTRRSPRRAAGARSAAACRSRARSRRARRPRRRPAAAREARGRARTRPAAPRSDRARRRGSMLAVVATRACTRHMGARGQTGTRGPARRHGHAARLEDPAAAARGAARAARRRRRRGRPRRARCGPRSRYYRAHLHEGATPRRSPRCGARCAEAMRPALRRAGAPRRRTADGGAARRAALPRLPRRRAGAARAARARLRLVVVSNWDVSLHERLAETGLAPLVDGAVASAELGARQAGRARIFEHALGARRRGAPRPPGTWATTSTADVAGARAARASGPCSWIAAGSARRRPPACPSLRGLDGLPALVARGGPYA